MKKRWLPHVRFSLRTLLLCVLTLASGATLWWNWGPWALVYALRVENTKNFSRNEKYIGLRVNSDAAPGTEGDRVVFYDLDTGKECLQEVAARHPTLCTFSETGRYVALKTRTQSLLFDTVTKSFGELPNDKSKSDDPFDIVYQNRFVDNDTWLVHNGEKTVQFHLPDLKPAEPGEVAPTSDIIKEKNDRWRVERKGKHVRIFAAGSETVLHELDLPEGTKWIGLHGDILKCEGEYEVHLYNMKSGRFIKSFKDLGNYRVNLPASGKSVIVDRNLYCVGPAELWQLEPEVKLIRTFTTAGDECYFEFLGERLLCSKPLMVISPATGEPLWSRSGVGKCLRDWKFVLWLHDGESSLLDIETGRKVFQFSRLRQRGAIPEGSIWVDFDKQDPTRFISYGSALPPKGRGRYDGDLESIASWRLRRPIEWYGIAWLPEFWLTVVLGVALVWSAWRDRRMA